MTLPYMPQSGCSSLQALCGVSGITCHLHRTMLSLFRSEALVPAEPHGLLRSRDLIHLGPKSPPQKKIPQNVKKEGQVGLGLWIQPFVLGRLCDMPILIARMCHVRKGIYIKSGALLILRVSILPQIMDYSVTVWCI